MGAGALITCAVGMTLARQVTSDAGPNGRDVSRTIIGGAILTTVILGVEQANADIARGLAALIFTTAVLVHGVGLAQDAIDVTT